MMEVTKAEYVEAYKLWVEFNDGQSGVVDLEPDLWGPVFEPLKDVSQFKRFHVSETFHTIVWENGADLAPEHLHSRLSAEAPEHAAAISAS